MGQQHGTAAGCSAPVSSSLSLLRGRAHAFSISPPTPPVTQVLAPSVPTSELLLSSLLMTATSSPVPVGVISKPGAGNTQYKYGVLISPLRGAGSGNPGVTPSPPSSPCPAAPRPRQPPARLLPAASPLPGVQVPTRGRELCHGHRRRRGRNTPPLRSAKARREP